jgi:hypothetical protein
VGRLFEFGDEGELVSSKQLVEALSKRLGAEHVGCNDRCMVTTKLGRAILQLQGRSDLQRPFPTHAPVFRNDIHIVKSWNGKSYELSGNFTVDRGQVGGACPTCAINNKTNALGEPFWSVLALLIVSLVFSVALWFGWSRWESAVRVEREAYGCSVAADWCELRGGPISASRVEWRNLVHHQVSSAMGRGFAGTSYSHVPITDRGSMTRQQAETSCHMAAETFHLHCGNALSEPIISTFTIGGDPVQVYVYPPWSARHPDWPAITRNLTAPALMASALAASDIERWWNGHPEELAVALVPPEFRQKVAYAVHSLPLPKADYTAWGLGQLALALDVSVLDRFFTVYPNTTIMLSEKESQQVRLITTHPSSLAQCAERCIRLSECVAVSENNSVCQLWTSPMGTRHVGPVSAPSSFALRHTQ